MLERYDMGQGNTLDDRIIGALVKELVQQVADKADDVCVWIEETDSTMVVQVEVTSSDFDRVVGEMKLRRGLLGLW